MSDLTPYAGRWVALIDGLVVGVGHTAVAAQQAAQRNRPKERVALRFIEATKGELLPFAPLLAEIRPLLAKETMPIYLVGGAVRDALLGRVSHDLDFVVPRDAIKLTFRIANALHLPAYVLDRERDAGRIVLPDGETTLDFTRFRGPNLDADLKDRDFTINAIAIPATAERTDSIIDMVGGLDDLFARKLELTHSGALTADPVRALRAVRLAYDLDFSLSSGVETAVPAAIPFLESVSRERVRDELLKILQTAVPDAAISKMADLGLLAATLPEIAALANIQQSPPHHEPVLPHTLHVLHYLVQLEKVLFAGISAIEEPWRQLQVQLQPFVSDLKSYLARPVDGGLNGAVLLRLSALFHDVGKAATHTVDDNGRIRFIGHDKVGAQIAAQRLRRLSMSNEAIDIVKHTVAGHMRPLLLASDQGGRPSRRAVYRYFRATQATGLDIGLLALADHLATYAGPGDDDQWQALLSLVAALYRAYFERFDVAVKPTPLLNGRDLMQLLNLEPGPEIGRLLRLIEEKQATGEITTRAEALRFAQEQVL